MARAGCPGVHGRARRARRPPHLITPDSMPELLPPVLGQIRTLLLDPDALVRAVGAGRRKGLPRPAATRVEVRPVDLKAGRRLLVASWDGVQTTTEHLAYGCAAEAAVDGLLAEAYGNWHVETVDQTLQLRVTKKGEAQLHRAEADRAQRTAHDRPAGHLLPADDPVFEVVAADADKRRQVEAFLRALDPVVPDATDRPLGLVDLGCGNAALTLATYRHLTVNYRRQTRVVGVDVKAQARRHNQAAAERLGWQDDVSFVESSIIDAEVDLGPAALEIVVALHACDTATDDALARAVRWRTPVILAAPCCHHDLQQQLSRGPTPEPYALLTRNGILRERFADVLTDALRAEVLRLLGYRVEVIEFIGSRHTPRNTLIRAVRTDAPVAERRAKDFLDITRTWQVCPRLQDLLASELEPVLASVRNQ